MKEEVKQVPQSLTRDIVYMIRDFLMIDLKEFIKKVFGTIKALLRLILLTVNFLLSGINNVLFAGREICDYDFVFDYLSQDIDKLSYIDKLNAQIEGDDEDDLDEYIIIEGDDEDDK